MALTGCGKTAAEKQREADGVNNENVAALNATKSLTDDWNAKNERWLVAINNDKQSSAQIYRKAIKVAKSMKVDADEFETAAADLTPGRFKTYVQKISELWQAQYGLIITITEHLRDDDVSGANAASDELTTLAKRENEIRKQVQDMAPGDSTSNGN
ncbi:MAG: hypothetical protein JHC87_00185 [Thermoleophilaceae bacterium]|nr:hypothetical protein [Thermoleophilaceae bacterium]